MEKSILFILFSCAFVLIVSCANGHTAVLTDSNGDTLRSRADNEDKEILWTRELESMRLVQNITTGDGVDNAVKLTPQSIIASSVVPVPVYPAVDGFGSVDTSLISPELKTALESACGTISAQKSADPLMADGCLYSYVLFLSDLKTGWKEKFGEDIPDADSSGNLFTKEIYGAPFIDDDYEVPVRFECKKGYVDILICFIKNDNGYRIHQLIIQKWGGADGK
ncbi:MAG: hypothetical protein M0P01_10885 [Treponema sp.]|nr:hypothetical protein [Treponema sp.]